jgi:putative ABC transport system ATP-binding protein
MTSTTLTTATLEVRGVARTYGSGRTSVAALAEVSFSVQPGELVAIMGPSGSGKSTLLAIAGGLDRATEGQVLVNGSDLGVLDARALAQLRRRTIGYVFQELNLLGTLTAEENVALPLELDGVRPKTAASQARSLLGELGLAELEDRFPDQLSGGEQQRVAIARAVVGQRRLLLADEPTGALDSLTGEAVVRLLRHQCDNGCAAVLVTHDARLAAWADRVVFLRDGRMVDQTAANDDLDHPSAPGRLR